MNPLRTALATLAFAFSLGLVGPAEAQINFECVSECRQARNDCRGACNADFRDCLRGPRLEARLCRADCRDTTEEETTEREDCLSACRADIFAPAREACSELRQDCRPVCSPRGCRRGCRGGDGPVLDECTQGCVSELRACANEGREERRECGATCREIEDETARRECFEGCVDSLGEGHGACRSEFETCAGGCQETSTTTTTTTTLP